MSYTFKALRDPDNAYDTTNVIFEVDAVERRDLIEAFINFLSACGYQVDDLQDILY